MLRGLNRDIDLTVDGSKVGNADCIVDDTDVGLIVGPILSSKEGSLNDFMLCSFDDIDGGMMPRMLERRRDGD